MCDVLDRIEARGTTLGEEKKAREVTLRLYEQGMDESLIASIVGVTVDCVRRWLGVVPV